MRTNSDEKKIVLEKLGGPASRRLASDTERTFFLDVTASGHVFIHKRGERCYKGALPVFSTNTMREAEMLRVRHCRLARDGSGLYQLNDPPVSVEDLDRITVLFRSSYKPKSAPKKNK